MTDIKSESTQGQAEGTQHRGIGRRRLLRAGLVATPVVLAVSGRSAMAATCPAGPLSGPTWNSIDPDGEPHDDCIASSHHVFSSKTLGRSPEYWKPHPLGQTFQPPYPWPIAPFTSIEMATGEVVAPDAWGQGARGHRPRDQGTTGGNVTTVAWDPNIYKEYKGISNDAAGWASGIKYNAIFRGSFEGRSFSRILLDDSGSLEGHFCTAYLNAAVMPGTYAMTVQEVLDLASTGCLVRGGKQLTAGQIKAFLSQTWA